MAIVRNASRIAALTALTVGLSGCGVASWFNFGSDPASFVGLPFTATLDTGETDREFTVTAEVLGASLEDARESIRHPATRHCIDTTGFSEVDWVIDPATSDWAVSRTEDGSLIASGRCALR